MRFIIIQLTDRCQESGSPIRLFLNPSMPRCHLMGYEQSNCSKSSIFKVKEGFQAFSLLARLECAKKQTGKVDVQHAGLRCEDWILRPSQNAWLRWEHTDVDQYFYSRLCPPFLDYFLNFLGFLFENTSIYFLSFFPHPKHLLWKTWGSC